jgi:hypothetical protein
MPALSVAARNREDEERETMRPFAGITDVTKPGLAVEECARRLQRYAAVERQLMRIAAGHLQGTPEWELKAAQARHLWEDAEHADWLLKRLPQLRSNVAGVDRLLRGPLGTFLVEALHCRNSVEYLTGVYGVVKPALLRAYRRYLAETSPFVDQPTCRLLDTIIREEEAQLEWASEAIGEVCAGEANQSIASAWQRHLEAYLGAAGGIDGDEPVPEAALPDRRSDQPFRVAPEAARDDRFWTQVPKGWSPGSGDPLRDKILQTMWVRAQEVTVVEVVGTILFEWDGLPWEAQHDIARHLWDEMRHALMGQAALESEGIPLNQPPMWIGYALHQMALSPRDRYGHLVFGEMSAMRRKEPSKRASYEFVRDVAKHPLMTLYQDFDWADEVVHAQFGHRWFVEYAFGGDRAAADAVGQMTVEERRAFYERWRREHAEDGHAEAPRAAGG